MQLTYIIDEDRRDLVNDIQNFKIDFKESNYNWIQARQYENSMRQAFVNVKYKDDTAFNLTGCNIIFEGLLPDKTSRIYDNWDGVILDPLAGQFRFDFPKQAFAIAGSYVQAFFRIMRDGDNVATLEFDMTVLADKVISGLIPADYITPFEDLYTQLEDIVKNAGADLQAALDNWNKKFQAAFDTVTSQINTLTDNFKTNSQDLLDEWKQKFSDAVKAWSDNYDTLTTAKNTLTEQYNTLQDKVNALEKEISDKNIVTTDMLELMPLANIALNVDTSKLQPTDIPRFAAYGYYGGAGIAQTELFYGVPETFLLDFTVSLKGSDSVIPKFSATQLETLLPDLDKTAITLKLSSDGKWAYLYSNSSATIGIQCLNTIFK
ncbi:phage baseplate upper protein [Lactiplantibacillus plantarum]|uniref:phage baseplate upper protein n=1 Tax=Lactiplantibacillus plantarum TaxID=1590 RepID=UPI001BACCCC9|nr:BppU family phage baseplate upper protein [Lactiplantibacillus plantarum]MBS0938065.1 BppU family phage baseplate upper protein [Lactiplantibacillus plantarum]MBS0943626.1 BppU family phage baseplate upper protein [Lactiplantibacillus plantarum]